MSVYLHDIPLPEAQARFRQAIQDAGLWRVLGTELILLDENSLGRVTAEPIWAKISSPHYHASAMDGFAVRAIATNGALPSRPLMLEIGPEAEYVDTGDPLPDWANSVIPIENVESLDELGNITAEIRKPASIRIRSSVEFPRTWLLYIAAILAETRWSRPRRTSASLISRISFHRASAKSTKLAPVCRRPLSVRL